MKTFWTYAAKDATSIDLTNKQNDLMYFDSLFVKTGMNLNDDVFLSDETWAARRTVAHKPVDIEHQIKVNDPQASLIIGTLMGSSIEGFDGNLIDIELQENPSDFAIITVGCVWKYLFTDMVNNIQKKVDAGEMYVSMEAWFGDYDYAIDTVGVIQRNSKTSFLDKCLRVNGGTGLFKDKRVGRVLRRITFGGVGFVSNPAEPDAKVRSVADVLPDDSNKRIEQNVVDEFHIDVDTMAYILSRTMGKL